MFIGPRLVLEYDSEPDGREFLYSGNGSTVDVLVRQNGSWKLSGTINVFADHCSTVSGIVVVFDKQQDKKLLCCFGEKHLAIFARDDAVDDEQTVPRSCVRTLGDWILGVRPIGITSNKIAVAFRSNIVHTYQFYIVQDYILHLDELETIRCKESVALFSAVFTGNTFNELRVLAGNVKGEVIIWRPSTKGEVERKIDGHTGAIFSLLEHEEKVYTISDDRSLRVWSADAEKHDRIKFAAYAHSARPYAITESCKYGVITGGADGNVCFWAFEMGEGFGLRKKIAATKSVIRSLCLVEDTLFIGTDNGELSSFLLHENDFPRSDAFCPKVGISNFVEVPDGRLFFLNKDNDFVESDNGAITKIEKKLRSPRYDTLKLSPSGQWIAWNLDHEVCLFSVDRGTITKKKISSLTSLHFLSNDCLLVSSMDGSLTLINPQRNVQIMTFGLRAKSVPTCAFLHIDVLYVGLKTGHIAVFKMTRTDPILLVMAHGKEPVLDIASWKDRILSVGKNGRVCEWRLDMGGESPATLTPLNKRPLGSMGLMEWPSRIMIVDDRVKIAGFHGEDFVLLDLTEETVVCRYKCGGGKREWQCTPSRDVKDQYVLRYIRNTAIKEVAMNACEKRAIGCGLHTGQINCITSIPIPKPKSKSGDNDGPPSYLVITGGVDTEVVVSKIDLNGRKQILNHNKALSGVFDISVIEKCQYVLSVGARSELIVRELDGRTANMIEKGRFRLENNDCRFVSCQLLMRIVENEKMYYAVVAGSDGTIRLFSIDVHVEDPSKIATLMSEYRSPDLSMFTKLSASIVKDTVRVYAVLSSGKFVRLNISLNSAEDENHENSPCSPERDYPVCKCGLSALDVFSVSEQESLVAFGDESGCLYVVVDPHDSRESIKVAALNRTIHSSNITHISIIGKLKNMFFMVLTGTDSRVSLVSYDRSKNDIRLLKQVIVNVSDPAAIERLDKNDLVNGSIKCLVVGSGVQMVDFQKRNEECQSD